MSSYAAYMRMIRPASIPRLLELRRKSIDTAVFIPRHLDHSAPGHGAACDGGQDADTAPGPRRPVPARHSAAALRSAGAHRGHQPPLDEATAGKGVTPLT